MENAFDDNITGESVIELEQEREREREREIERKWKEIWGEKSD